MILNPLYHETCTALTMDPLPDPAPVHRVGWSSAPSELDGALPAPLPLERVAQIFDVPAEVVAAIPPGYTAELNTDRVIKTTPDGFVVHDMPARARRPWVPAAQLDDTQSIPTIQVDSL